MSTTTEFWSRYNAWSEERADIQRRDGDGIGIVSSSEWQGSDDDAFDLLETAVGLLRQPMKVWTCAVKTPDSPGVVAFVRFTEDECFEALRELYDPEGEADDEPPVAIVGHLEDDGYTINVDVHEVSR